ncbi:MAG TPA: hypothetical protein VFX53_18305 [Pedococcus sp.]|jgi:hypothetical protein|nr:hypothetical protein [Pedococcus sp.]
MGRQEKAERDAACAAFVEQSTPSLLRSITFTGADGKAHSHSYQAGNR